MGNDTSHMTTVLISAAVAIVVVLLNQWFLSRRAKKELMIKKVEELFSASTEYTAACRELMKSLNDKSLRTIHGYYDYPADAMNRLNDSITKMQMICGLYFRKEKFDPNDFYVSRMPIFRIEHKGLGLSEGEGYAAHKASEAHIRDSRVKLDNLCKSLMKKYGH